MTPAEAKSKIQSAYQQSMRSSTIYYSSGSHLQHLFRELRLYGHDAGTDFVETHFGDIFNEAVESAQRKQPSLQITAHSFGKAAIGAIAQKLREKTDLKVEVSGSAVTLVWAEPNIGLI